MKIYLIKLYQEFDAPVEQVWEDFNDHAILGTILGQNINRIKDSDNPKNINGVNSVRLIKIPFAPFEETIRKSVKPACIEYQVSKGTPLHHHYGKMQFKSLSAEKSALDYTIELGSKIPVLAGILKIAIQNSIEAGLKKYDEQLKK
ncbi:MAG: hypothetical protein AB7G44_11465 [Bacteroidia bacterium]